MAKGLAVPADGDDPKGEAVIFSGSFALLCGTFSLLALLVVSFPRPPPPALGLPLLPAAGKIMGPF